MAVMDFSGKVSHFAVLLRYCLTSTSVVKLRMPLHLNFGVLILISNSSLNKSSCGTPLSASVFALECRGAVTCVAPPFELPYCFADENRLYTSRCVMNCPAYDSNYRPMMRKNTTFFKSSPSVCSLPERTRRSPEIVLDVAREVAEGGEVEAVGDVGEREAPVFEQVREFHGGVAVNPVVG